MTQDYQVYLPFAKSLADLARPIARRYFQQSVNVAVKADHTPVTIADKEIEQAIRCHIRQRFPDHAIMGEEFGTENKEAEYCWVIDPIDGTKAFIAGRPTFTTLIGLTHRGRPVLGIVDQPISEERWAAVYSRDLAAPSADPQPVALQGLRMTTTSEGYFTPAQENAISRMRGQGADIAAGGDAYAYMMLLEGKLDAVFDVGFKPYDILPLMPILQKTGIWLGFFADGKQVTHVTDSVVAAREQSIGEQVLRELTV